MLTSDFCSKDNFIYLFTCETKCSKLLNLPFAAERKIKNLNN